MELIKVEKLKPIHTHQRSFYNRAFVKYYKNGLIVLQSYSTNVASINPTHEYAHVYGWYSVTTAKHINEFLQQHSLDKMSKREMILCAQLNTEIQINEKV